jgi:hypothetical protein
MAIRIWHHGGEERRERIRYGEWVKRGGKKPGKYEVRVIYFPQRFPTYSVLWTDPVLNVDVRASINQAQFKELFRGWKPNQIIYYVVLEDGTDGFTWEDSKDGRQYQRETYGYVLRNSLPEDEEWESLGF